LLFGKYSATENQKRKTKDLLISARRRFSRSLCGAETKAAKKSCRALLSEAGRAVGSVNGRFFRIVVLFGFSG